MFPSVRAALGRTPTLLLLEDVHWADEATLDLIRYLGRRMDGQPLMVVATFRDDEVAGMHPLAGVMGDLATTASVRRMQLPLLTEAAVAELARNVDVDVAALHRNTAGNPFFVTEVLAARSETLPATVRDAVTARAARLTTAARRALDTAAVVGATAEIDVVLDVSGQSSAAVDECVEGGVLLGRGPSVAYRHELARQAILDTMPPASRADLHRKVLARLLAGGGTDHRRLAQHAVACGDAAAVVAHAPLAAELSARLGSHREAAEHLRTALHHGGALAATDRADLLARLSYECYLTSQLAEAIDTRREAVALHKAAGDARRLGVGQRWLSRLSWFLGRHEDAERYALAAVATLELLGSGRELAMAYSNVSQLRMLSGATREGIAWGERALNEAHAGGDREVESHALNNVGTALLCEGDLAEGQALLDESLAIALADGLQEHAARAWTNVGSTLAVKRLLPEAERTLRTGLFYCTERDLDSWSLYMRAWLAGILLERGNTDAAVRTAREVLRRPQLSLVSRIVAMLVTAVAAVRRGEPAVNRELAELTAMARGTADAQRILPVALLQAEAAWTAGAVADIVALTDEAWVVCARVGEPWLLAELAWWRSLGGGVDTVPFDLPEPFALMRDGRVQDASEAWSRIDRPFWAALALAAGDPAQTSDAVAAVMRIDAPATAQAVRRDLARRGLPVPRGPRGTAQSNPAGLTARELDVLRLLVEGLTDAEIAARLTLSERTVGHHVSAILRKLAVPTRSRAAAAAAQVLGAQSPT